MSRPARTVRTARLLAATAVGLLVAPAVQATPLGTLLGGGTLSTSDAALVFGDFSVSIDRSTGEGDNPFLYLDLMLVEVSIVESGDVRSLAIEGPLQVSAWDDAQIRIDYAVGAGEGSGIVAAGLSLKAEALGDFADVVVTEALSGDAAAVLRAVESQDQAARLLGGQTTFGAPARSLLVSTDITLSGGMTQGSRIARLEQGFTVSRVASPVPEPGAALLFAAGVAVTAGHLRTRRSRP
jgi:hypothetical protein